MVAGEERHSFRFRCRDQAFPGSDVVGQRFFDQGRNAGLDGFETVLHVDLVGGRDNDAVGPIDGDHVGKAGEPPRAGLPCHRLAVRRGIHHGTEHRIRFANDVLDVSVFRYLSA